MVPGEVNLIVLQFYLFFTCWEIRTRPEQGRGEEGGGRMVEVLITAGRREGGGRLLQTCLNGKGKCFNRKYYVCLSQLCILYVCNL